MSTRAKGSASCAHLFGQTATMTISHGSFLAASDMSPRIIRDPGGALTCASEKLGCCFCCSFLSGSASDDRHTDRQHGRDGAPASRCSLPKLRQDLLKDHADTFPVKAGGAARRPLRVRARSRPGLEAAHAVEAAQSEAADRTSKNSSPSSSSTMADSPADAVRHQPGLSASRSPRRSRLERELERDRRPLGPYRRRPPGAWSPPLTVAGQARWITFRPSLGREFNLPHSTCSAPCVSARSTTIRTLMPSATSRRPSAKRAEPEDGTCSPPPNDRPVHRAIAASPVRPVR